MIEAIENDLRTELMNVCSHEYTLDYSQRPSSFGKRCPYIELCKELPVDERNSCIFHSREIEWKRTNDFHAWFFRILKILSETQGIEQWDFTEFVFVGGDRCIPDSSQEKALRFASQTFPVPVYFTGASFYDPVEIVDVEFAGGLICDQTTFHQGLQITDTKFRSVDFEKVTAKGRVSFANVQCKSYALFDRAQFTFKSNSLAVTFEDVSFAGITNFSDVNFDHEGEATVEFSRVKFEDIVDFSRTTFRCHVVFEDVAFGFLTEFVGTSFEPISSVARYRGSAVEFNRIIVGPNAVVTFRGSAPSARMFDHDVQMSFSEEPSGIVQFENVNFNKFSRQSRERLIELARFGRVEIGTGCIKYRLQTEVRSIPVSGDHTSLVLELCQTFTNYFAASKGINLGFEIVERTKKCVSFFYFTDENLEEGVFLERLKATEHEMWNLLSIQSTSELASLGSSEILGQEPREKGIINAIDGLSALIGTFFRVGARIALGSWEAKDTQALLGVIQFNKEGARKRALDLHGMLVEKYTGRALLDLSGKQNQPLSLMENAAAALPQEKKRILFLGVNSLDLPLDLGEEVRKIQLKLRTAKDRDNLEFKQEWSVRADTLTQAMAEERPHIVHFSGHGDEFGIHLRDERGARKIVAGADLANLFEVFKDCVQCVVLNSCYSEHQARAIRRHIPYVIGIKSAILDEAALAFSAGFYTGIGAGLEIPKAFDLGRACVRLEGFADDAALVFL